MAEVGLGKVQRGNPVVRKQERSFMFLSLVEFHSV